MSLIASIDDRRIQVERALERLDLGTYGQCEVCRKPISPERLEAFPAATCCVSCKRANERRG
jgi:DnaK suppressor protein